MGTQNEKSEVAERIRRFENLNHAVSASRIISKDIEKAPNIDHVAATLYSRLLSLQEGNIDFIQNKLIAQQAVLDELFYAQVDQAAKSGNHEKRMQLIDSAYKAQAQSRNCLVSLLQSAQYNTGAALAVSDRMVKLKDRG